MMRDDVVHSILKSDGYGENVPHGETTNDHTE